MAPDLRGRPTPAGLEGLETGWRFQPTIAHDGELTFGNGKAPFLMGTSTISMAIFHCFLLVHQRVYMVLHGSTFTIKIPQSC